MPSNVLSNNRSASREDSGWEASRRAKAKGFKIIESTGSDSCNALVAGRRPKPLREAPGSGGEVETATQTHFSVFRRLLPGRLLWPNLGLAVLVGILPAVLQASEGRPNLIWQANLQGIHDLVIQGDRVTIESKSGPMPTKVIYRFVTPMPA